MYDYRTKQEAASQSNEQYNTVDSSLQVTEVNCILLFLQNQDLIFIFFPCMYCIGVRVVVEARISEYETETWVAETKTETI